MNKTGKRALQLSNLNIVEVNPNDLLRSEEKANVTISESSKGKRESKNANQPLNKTFVEEDVSASVL